MAPKAPIPLERIPAPVYTYIFTGVMPAKDEFDPSAPQREAAMFYGLFLRGHSPESLRRDIDVPKSLLEKWMRSPAFEASFRESLRRLYRYRKQVLAIFDELVCNEKANSRCRLQ